MAATLGLVVQRSQSFCRSTIVWRGVIRYRNFSTKTAVRNTDVQDENKVKREPTVGMSADGRTVIAWHPEPTHPYEHTLPIDYNTTEAREGGSVLKDHVLRQYQIRFRSTGPNMHELTNITHTTKHQWYPKPEKKYRKRNPPKDRDAI